MIDDINKWAFENLARKLNEANSRIVEFEDIKRGHLTFVNKLEDEVRILREALEFYASTESWRSSSDNLYEIAKIRYDDLEIIHLNMANPSIGGKRARQILQRGTL